MSTEVILEYKRVDMLSSGRIYVHAIFRDEEGNVVGGGGGVTPFEFERLDFEAMLFKFAEYLQQFPNAVGVIQRTDRPNLVPYTLDERTTELFRLDPVAAVKSMSAPMGSPSNVIKRVREEKTPITSGLRVGHSTLADAFGEELYSRYDVDRMRVECPCCGIWAALHTRDEDGKQFISCKNPSCAPHGKPLFLQRRNGRWAAFSTFDLLATHSDRFYFPRAWNDGKVWITWEGLNNKYEQFQKEKKSCP